MERQQGNMVTEEGPEEVVIYDRLDIPGIGEGKLDLDTCFRFLSQKQEEAEK